ncbi:polyprenyl synthetase family protein [Megasphaera vaginalis (ex Srinivasan et al. 2021)]|uniref:Polyprenyl synthetase n=1 Tax=Megasphaera vaginalis (ex Srinivasan et al. 2021) TaxID=1111454 RepID=U7UHR6_9FIRM|nr:polyprenyl synthetase family protein [Megasphaera vaginalis (ex Srinivasan et al. 2021)]ERT57993.1 polyprenyl synthetase [Megasphaera vaginalis (ex Srinivasan et al. 2021)]
MINQTILENSHRKLMPKLFACIHDEQIQKVKEYIKIYTQHPFAGTETGAILEEAASSAGKMLRPRLLLMAGAFGKHNGDTQERLYKLAAIVEIAHSASLIHDDIIDNASFRRGNPSIQSKYGKSAAIYAGDFLMSRISSHVMREGLTHAGSILFQAVAEMCAGEIGQARCLYKETVTLDEYLHNIGGKTVALFRACCRMGAVESGCSEDLADRLEAFGECLGYMFQIRDDLLDFTPSRTLIGKNTHQDVREGIYTLPILLTLENPAGRQALSPYLKRNREGDLSDNDMQQIYAILTAYDGILGAWEYIHNYQKQADSILNSLPPADVLPQLKSLIRKLGTA